MTAHSEHAPLPLLPAVDTPTTTTTTTTTTATSITVLVRVRPLLPSESGSARSTSIGPQSSVCHTSSLDSLASDTAELQSRIVTVLDEHVIVFDPKNPNKDSSAQRRYTHRSRRNKELRYSFDKVLGEQTSQQQLFETASMPLIDFVLDGYNATVFAYGATGCGKTHTITGTPLDPGIIPRTVQELFSRIAALENDHNRIADASISYLEVYNETIRDLLTPSSPLDLREDASRVVVAGLSEHTPATIKEVMDLLLRGNENRTKAPTLANAVSSRSHAVLQIHLRHRDKCSSSLSVVKMSTLSIIDLAGSERASATRNTGERLLEGANINRSLLALGNCINALCSDRPNHIPYRDSKLTRLLKFSLSGNCKVVMIANISPASIHYEETQNTLKYANRAKNIKTKVTQNTLNMEAHIGQYPKIIEALRAEILSLRSLGASQTSSSQKQLPQPGGIIDESEDPTYLRIIKKATTLVAKFEGIQENITTFEAKMNRNESLVKILKSFIVALTQIPQLPMRYMSILTNGIDSIHAENATLRHNIDSARNACEQLISSLECLHNHRRLQSPLLRERLTLDVSTRLTQVQLRLVSHRHTTLDETSVAVSTLLFQIMQFNTDVMSSMFNSESLTLSKPTALPAYVSQHLDAFITTCIYLVLPVEALLAYPEQSPGGEDTASTTGIPIVDYDSCQEDNDSVFSDRSSIIDWDNDDTQSAFDQNQNLDGSDMPDFDMSAPFLDQLFFSAKGTNLGASKSTLHERSLQPLPDMDSDLRQMKMEEAAQFAVGKKKCDSMSTEQLTEPNLLHNQSTFDFSSHLDSLDKTPLPPALHTKAPVDPYVGTEQDNDATPMSKHRTQPILHGVVDAETRYSNEACTPSSSAARRRMAPSSSHRWTEDSRVNQSGGSRPGPMRLTPIRREHRRKARQSLIPIMRPVVSRPIPDGNDFEPRTELINPFSSLRSDTDTIDSSLANSAAVSAEMVARAVKEGVQGLHSSKTDSGIRPLDESSQPTPLRKLEEPAVTASSTRLSTMSKLRSSRRK
ncbi:hypothetical protein BASA50_001932 [Batrachochytrium salamandrivorans]|uniref:Kinesin motor domain-containing protein n=1 Tax=Batrachochytrium salamandrivorans TaxID=1357716 RepID=A0ABQ8FMQ4_9FUNG|nr:hypothetical protein BASA50_001932 [Batrachochytrium salamandrivorans]